MLPETKRFEAALFTCIKMTTIRAINTHSTSLHMVVNITYEIKLTLLPFREWPV